MTRAPARWSTGPELDAVRAMVEDDYTIAEIARKFGTNRNQIRALIARHGWHRAIDGRALNMKRLNARPERAEWDRRKVAAIKTYWAERHRRETPEVKAKRSLATRRRWSGPEREAMVERSRAALAKARAAVAARIPAPGTDDRRTYEKIRDILGAEAARAEFARRA